MKFFVAIVAFITILVIAWKYAPIEFRVAARTHLKATWWVPVSIMLGLFVVVVVLSNFSIKFF